MELRLEMDYMPADCTVLVAPPGFLHALAEFSEPVEDDIEIGDVIITFSALNREKTAIRQNVPLFGIDTQFLQVIGDNRC